MTAAVLRRPVESNLNAWLTLTKVRICAVSTLTAAMGYVAESRTVNLGLWPTVAGTMLLAMASSALNEVQERDVDALMSRTSARPIPSGAISVRQAKVGAGVLALLGTLLLYLTNGAVPALLGLLALGWYNGLYTPLKRVTAFAVVPGSVIGALPPAIGWTAAGGDGEAPALLALCFVFFMWQVPHFWLLALRHQRDYAKAGFPTLSTHFSGRQILRLVFTWTVASISACSLLWVFQTVTGWVATVAIALVSTWLLARFAFMLGPKATERGREARAFLDINWFALVVIAAVMFDALAGS